MNMKNVLMTGAGAPGGPGILRALTLENFLNVSVGDADVMASGRFLAKNFYKMPSADESNFCSEVLSICELGKIDIIFPLVTKELFHFAESKNLFLEKGVQVIVSDYSSLQIVNDKIRLYDFLSSHSLRVPAYFSANSVEELNAHVYDLGYPDKPVVVKPAISNGSRGIRVLDERRDRYDDFFKQKPSSLYSNLDEINKILHGKSIPPMLVSEYLPGPEITVDSLKLRSGEIIITVRTREKMNGGISIAGKFVELTQINKYVSRVHSLLDLNGPIGFQFKQGVDGSFYIIEINPRIQGTSVASLGLGINFPLLAVKNQLGLPISAPTRYSGVGFCRYYEEVFYESD